MSQVFQFAVIGLGAGSLYAIAAIGLVLVFRGSRVVNFAQGAMGMMAAYVFYELHQNWHLSVVLAIPAGLLVSGALGAAFYYFEIRQLKDASNLIKIVATLALFVIAQEVINLVFGAQPRTVTSSLPTSSVTIFGASIGEDRLWIFGIVIVLTVVLWAIYKYTTFGLATTAVAENPTAAATLAISPDVVAAANWFIGAALGGLAAILLVPITTLSAENLSLIVIPILAAAVIGGFSSFPITTIAGLVLGVAQSEVTRYVSTPGWDTAVPFIAVTLILFFRGRRVAGRGEFFGKLPSVGSGRIAPYLLILGSGISLLCIWIIFPYDWLVALEYQLVFAIIITSLVVVTGYCGQISLAQMAFAGVGGLIASWLYSTYHVDFLIALLAGVVAVVPAAVVVALAGVRTRGVALAIVTLGLAFSLEAIIFTNTQFTGGPEGFVTDDPHLLGLPVGGLEYPARFATLTLGLPRADRAGRRQSAPRPGRAPAHRGAHERAGRGGNGDFGGRRQDLCLRPRGHDRRHRRGAALLLLGRTRFHQLRRHHLDHLRRVRGARWRGPPRWAARREQLSARHARPADLFVPRWECRHLAGHRRRRRPSCDPPAFPDGLVPLIESATPVG